MTRTIKWLIYSSNHSILHPISLFTIKKIMELTIIETSAYQELKRQLSTLSIQMADFQKKITPATPEK